MCECPSCCDASECNQMPPRQLQRLPNNRKANEFTRFLSFHKQWCWNFLLRPSATHGKWPCLWDRMGQVACIHLQSLSSNVDIHAFAKYLRRGTLLIFPFFVIVTGAFLLWPSCTVWMLSSDKTNKCHALYIALQIDFVSVQISRLQQSHEKSLPSTL